MKSNVSEMRHVGKIFLEKLEILNNLEIWKEAKSIVIHSLKAIFEH